MLGERFDHPHSTSALPPKAAVELILAKGAANEADILVTHAFLLS
jgi:hypothetical protein